MYMQYMLKKRGKASSFARGLQIRHAGVCNEDDQRGGPDPHHFQPAGAYSKEELKGLKAQICGREYIYRW